MKLKRFAQQYADSQKNDFWYELEDGIRVKCDEDVIHNFWCNWISQEKGIHRHVKDGYLIFEYDEPMEMEAATAENWI